MKGQLLTKCLLTILSSLFLGSALWAQEVQSEIYDNTISQSTVEALTKAVDRVLNGINRYKNMDLWDVGSRSDSELAIQNLRQMADTTALFIAMPSVELSVIRLGNGHWECREIFGIIENGDNQLEQELILVFDENFALVDARFAMGYELFRTIISESKDIKDEFRRRQIIGYLEHLRTAYNKKDIDYIEQQFSEDALIIVGTRVQKAPERYNRQPSVNSEKTEQFKLSKLTKKKYVSNLRDKVFKVNAFLDLEFKDIKIVQHHEYPEVYGVNLFQIWRSSTYSDEGYLYLMIDYEDEERPLIYVRAWQDELFADQSTFDFSYFKVIK